MSRKNAKIVKNKGERERLRLKKQMELAEEMLLNDESLEKELPPIEDDDDEAEEPETVEVKSMDAVVAGPTSWEDLDAEKVAREKAYAVREVSYNVQDLVGNILLSALAPEEKADAIAKVGDGFGKRVKSVLGEPMKKAIEDDMDLLEAQALLARDMRGLSVVEKIGYRLSKSFSAVDDADYLTDTKSHARQSLELAIKALKDGDEVARPTLLKVMEDSKKLGIGSVDRTRSAVIVEKDAKGSYRAVMWPSNNFRDLEGDILSEAAHLEYVEWVNKNMDVAPVFLSWHMPDTVRKNKVDFVSYDNGFLLMSAPLEKSEAAHLLKAQAITDLGMSHGSIAFDITTTGSSRIINKYRMVEVSDLPLENAANPFTDFSTLVKEASMDKKKYLATILGSDEKADAFMQKAGMKQQALRDAGVEEKELPADEAHVEAPAKGEGLTMEAIMAEVSKELDVPGLNQFLTEAKEAMEKVPLLEQLVKNIQTDTDEAVADAVSGRKPIDLVWKSRASAKDDNVIGDETEEDKALQKASPASHWLSEATGTEPVAVAES